MMGVHFKIKIAPDAECGIQNLVFLQCRYASLLCEDKK